MGHVITSRTFGLGLGMVGGWWDHVGRCRLNVGRKCAQVAHVAGKLLLVLLPSRTSVDELCPLV